jgi:hypothetical protein
MNTSITNADKKINHPLKKFAGRKFIKIYKFSGNFTYIGKLHRNDTNKYRLPEVIAAAYVASLKDRRTALDLGVWGKPPTSRKDDLWPSIHCLPRCSTVVNALCGTL